MTHRELFPSADPADPDVRRRMGDYAAELRAEIADGGYRSKRHESADRAALRRVERWLALPVPAAPDA